jgi:hypothetical protein
MEMMGGSIDEYKKRMAKDLKQPDKKKNKRGGGANKSPARLAAEKKKAKLMSEVGTNKTNTKSVLGVTDFAKKPKEKRVRGPKVSVPGSMRGGPPQRVGKTKTKTMPEKFAGTMKKISDDSKMAKPMTKPDSVKKKAKKAPIVTKEQLEKSGLSLRDYMNMMQGKTRRDKKGPEMSDEAFEARRNNPKKMMGGGMLKPKKKMMGGGMTKIKYRGGGIVKQGVRPTRYI